MGLCLISAEAAKLRITGDKHPHVLRRGGREHSIKWAILHLQYQIKERAWKSKIGGSKLEHPLISYQAGQHPLISGSPGEQGSRDLQENTPNSPLCMRDMGLEPSPCLDQSKGYQHRQSRERQFVGRWVKRGLGIGSAFPQGPS